MESISNRLKMVRDRINKAALDCGRNPESVRLIAVSKTISANIVEQAIKAGVTTLGENYVQEARDKISTLSEYSISWHFIGHLQSNKAKYAVKLFDLIHSVDSVKLAREINKQAYKIDKVQQILIQVNISQEKSKSGISVDETINLINEVRQFENLAVQGLMTMPPFFNQPDRVRPFFAALRDLRNQAKGKAMPGVSLDELSMGMTGDFEVAIAEGATMVRVGTAIFGERT
ncbi:MAG: YggS family pyridoxal phosphate-dependent enzyme, partial [Deltaproteobacteria bacterium]|nr:YggS family pyridoxal phosphate-dependent enzyme [Deltaproteobacteria bacterium]